MSSLDVCENEAFALQPQDVPFLLERMKGRFERRSDGWAVTRLVGHVWLPSGTLLRIHSRKSTGAAMIAWAAFCDPAFASLRHLHEIPDSAGAGDVGSLVARMFTGELRRVFARHGIRRGYFRARHEGSDVRGRIDFAALAQRGGDLSRMPCKVWERLPNTPLNRLLAAAHRCLVRDPALRAACMSDLGTVGALLEPIEPRIPLDLLHGRTVLDRADQPFECALSLARLLLQRCALGAGSQRAGLGFIIDVEALFERTVVRAIQTAGLDVTPKYSVRYHRVTSGEHRVTQAMEIDAFCGNTPVGPLVVDAKYKSAISSANIQQMVTYCVATGGAHAILVTPGLDPPMRYEVQPAPTWSPDGRPITLHRLGLDTSGRSIAAWRRAAEQLGQAIAAVARHGAETTASNLTSGSPCPASELSHSW